MTCLIHCPIILKIFIYNTLITILLPGAAVGRVVFSYESAQAWTGRGDPVILVRIETSPKDVAGAYLSVGLLTERGGMTSHAAVVARGCK